MRVFACLAIFAAIQDPDAIANKLRSDKDADRQAARKVLREWRESSIQKLLAVAKEPEAPNARNWGKRIAIELLGEYRAVEAAEILAREIDLQPSPLDDGGGMYLSSSHPSAKAIVKIGVPCVPYLLARLRNEKLEDRTITLIGECILLVYGSKELALLLLEQKLDKADTDEFKANLARSMEAVKKCK